MGYVNVYAGAASVVFLIGVGRLYIHWLDMRSVRRAARTLVEDRRAFFTEIPRQCVLDDEELLDERMPMAAVAEMLPGFRTLADYVDEYPPASPLARLPPIPTRALVDADGTTAAQVFLPPATNTVRVHLATELAGGRWLMTENDARHGHAKLVWPEGFEVAHLRDETSPADMVRQHRERLARVMGGEGASAAPVSIRTFEEFRASSKRRWDAIRAHRKVIGWVLPSEISVRPGTPQRLADRLYPEIRRILEAEASE